MVAPAVLASIAATTALSAGAAYGVNKLTQKDSPTPALPTLPTPAPDATSPTAKPARKGQQQSFLSGVAASSLGGQAGASQGKTLLGA
jgi:hypothetical protein